jgi:exodeoxyribonuclease VII large subunit
MNISSAQVVLTVSELTRSIKNLLEKEHRFIKISGEISNLRTPYSGHSYFTLKDSSSQIRAVLFKQQKRFVDTRLTDGQQVVCLGRVSVYEPRGEYQIILDSVELYGAGQLQLEFEKLKKELETLGYFRADKKKQIPQFANKIAVITSPTGAALQDFLKIVSLRQSPAQIQIFPVRVQGAEAPAEIARAITLLDGAGQHQVIVLCRGGGSIEDLWAFNDRRVAEAIHRATTPIVTGVGHEIDFTIADFCSDLRCPTPTAVAERLLPDNSELLLQIKGYRNRLSRQIEQRLRLTRQRLKHSVKMLGSLKTVVSDAEHRLELSRSLLLQSLSEHLGQQQARLQLFTAKLQAQAPRAKISMKEHRIAHLRKLLMNQMLRTIEKKEAQFAGQASLLQSVSPLATLGRGYSITRRRNSLDEKYQLIRKSSEVSPGDTVNVLLGSGDIDCQVLNRREPDEQ